MGTQNINADIIVCGAGPAGLVLSCLLAKTGLKIALIDAESPQAVSPRPSGRTAALFNGSVNIIKACGIWDDLSGICAPLRIMRIVDASGKSEARLEFQASEIDEAQFGYNVPNAPLRDALLNRAANLRNLTHLRPAKLSLYQLDGTSVLAETDSGTRINARLIVGTDGRNSAVRRIAGIEAKTRDYGQIAMTCLLDHTKPHEFASTEFHRPGGPFTFVPLPGNRSSLVWVEKAEDARKFLSMKHGEYQQAIQDRSHGLLGSITLASPPESWPLLSLSTDIFTAPRAVLAAEAAHVLSPLGAQGLNLSLRDVAVLAETIVDAARLGEDIGSDLVLGRYTARRRLDIALRTNGIDHYNRIVASDVSSVRNVKKLGIEMFGKIPALKDLAAEQALSPSLGGGRLIAGGEI